LKLIATIVIGTTNAAKARQCELVLAGSGVATMRLANVLKGVPEIAEDGGDPVLNATVKASAYAKPVGRPVDRSTVPSCFDGVAPDEQPGVNVRRIRGF